MFESVLERDAPPRQVGRGAGLAIGVHAVVIAGAMYFSARPAPAIGRQIPDIRIFNPRVTFDQPGPASKGGGSAEAKPRAEHKAEHKAWRSTPADVDKNKRRAEEPSSSAAVSTDSAHGTSDPGPATEGTGTGAGKGVGTGVGMGGGATIAIPFGEGMTRPSPITQPAPVYTREASAARAQGTASVRCVITVEGMLKDCRIVNGVPFMDGAVLDALSRWRYSPVMFQGHAVSVYYAINLRLIAP